MTPTNTRNKKNMAIKATSMVVAHHITQSANTVAKVVALVAEPEDKKSSRYSNKRHKEQGRYTRNVL